MDPVDPDPDSDPDPQHCRYNTIAMMDKCTDDQKKDSVLILHIPYVMIKKQL